MDNFHKCNFIQGKTALCVRYTKGDFEECYDPTIVNSKYIGTYKYFILFSTFNHISNELNDIIFFYSLSKYHQRQQSKLQFVRD